jgi:hypothetical protein
MSKDPHATSYLHCRVSGCPNLHALGSTFCEHHMRRKDHRGLPLRAPVAAGRKEGGTVGGPWLGGAGNPMMKRR